MGYAITVVRVGDNRADSSGAQKFFNSLLNSPVISPFVRLLFSRKGIAGLGVILFEMIMAYNGQVDIATAWQHAVVLTLTYIVATAWEDVSRTYAAKGRT